MLDVIVSGLEGVLDSLGRAAVAGDLQFVIVRGLHDGIHFLEGHAQRMMVVRVRRGGVAGRMSGRDNIGGLAGRSDDSSFEQASTSGVVRGNQDTSSDSPYFGGLIGYSLGTSLLRSHSSADVDGKNGWKIGGLIGQLSQGKVSECLSTGQVDGWARVGGLVGHVQGSSEVVSDCYAQGAVNGTQQVGGFVGLTYQGPTITRNYATGAVTGRTDTGGFAGRVSATGLGRPGTRRTDR